MSDDVLVATYNNNMRVVVSACACTSNSPRPYTFINRGRAYRMWPQLHRHPLNTPLLGERTRTNSCIAVYQTLSLVEGQVSDHTRLHTTVVSRVIAHGRSYFNVDFHPTGRLPCVNIEVYRRGQCARAHACMLR